MVGIGGCEEVWRFQIIITVAQLCCVAMNAGNRVRDHHLSGNYLLQNVCCFMCVLSLASNQAGNKSASCQDRDDAVKPTNSNSSQVIVIVLSLLLTVLLIAFIVTVSCLMTRHQQQLSALR